MSKIPKAVVTGWPREWLVRIGTVPFHSTNKKTEAELIANFLNGESSKNKGPHEWSRSLIRAVLLAAEAPVLRLPEGTMEQLEGLIPLGKAAYKALTSNK